MSERFQAILDENFDHIKTTMNRMITNHDKLVIRRRRIKIILKVMLTLKDSLDFKDLVNQLSYKTGVSQSTIRNDLMAICSSLDFVFVKYERLADKRKVMKIFKRWDRSYKYT
ncbi:MAG: hypothetical protein GTN97_08605 [Nitrosopumilaceae archaeon]|nr:hypothetical protein [Nitrosopumilaceae archaeon]